MQTPKRGFVWAVLLALFLPISGFAGGVVSSPTVASFNAALNGGGTVTFACSGTITFTSGYTFGTNTVIDATGNNITLSGNGTVKLFTVDSGVSLTLVNLTVANCHGTSGGAIDNQGTLTASNCVFYTNVVIGANGGNGPAGSGSGTGNTGTNGVSVKGGAVYNESGATAFFYGCTFQTNSATGGNGGNGGVGGSGSGTGGNGGVAGSGGSALGGALCNLGSAQLNFCVFGNNSAYGGTGGVGGNGGIGTSGFDGSGGSGGNGLTGYGGAIYNQGTLQVTNSTFGGGIVLGGNGGVGGSPEGTENYPGAGGNGGLGAGAGIFTTNNAATIVFGCTFNANGAWGGNTQTQGGSDTGGSGSSGNNGNPGGNAQGGGMANLGTNTVINCTLYGNVVTGGNGGNGENAYSGEEFYGGNGGSGGGGLGGNLYNSGIVGVTNCSLAVGQMSGGSGGSGGSGPSAGSAGSSGSALGADIYNTGGTFDLKNSILAYPYPTNLAVASGTITDEGNNISVSGTPTFTKASSTNNVNPQLAVLANYGGPTLTMALLTNSPAINAGDNTAAPPFDQRGYFRSGVSDIGAYEYGGAPLEFYALGPDASLDGNVGLFFFGGLANPATSPLTINYAISSTASNGVDYVSITNSVTIPTNATFGSVLIQGVPGAFSGTNASVTLTLLPGVGYEANPAENIATVILYPQSTFDASKRFVRGTSTAPDFQSFVIPLDAETGVPLAAVGGNATTLFPGNPWTTNFYHFNATNLAAQAATTNNRIVFQNPIVAFGSPVGGSPLYLNRSYNFGIYAGNAYASNLATALRIQVYYRSNSALAGTISLPILNTAQTNLLTELATNGFTQTFQGFGLQTVLWASPYANWGGVFGGDYILTQTASATATNYYYAVEEQGYGPGGGYLVLNSASTPDWSRLYAMEFSPLPANLPTFVAQPQFNGVPLPPEYQGKSVEELTNVVPNLPNLSSLIPSNYLTIDGSPELRRHPILDQFVTDMGNDPLALANYVINEIALTDAIDYDTNYNSQPAINVGGVSRSAFATFQEGQGSPVEQCALLVYLLRQAGVPATYIYPANNGLQMLDSQISKLLQMQLQGAVNDVGQTNLPQLVSVNYPWVAAYVGGSWVQIFPWLKDTEIVEGLNLYDYMPANYNSGYKWLTHFIAGDPNIFSLSSSDQPLDLLPLFLQNNLTNNFPGISVDDIGVQIVNRQHLYPNWNSFPLPFSLSGTPTVIESLKTNMNLFDTLEVRVYSQANPSKFIDTTELPILNFHDRKLLLQFVQLGGTNAHNMILTLAPFSTNDTGQAIFATNSDPTYTLSGTNLLNSNDDSIVFQVTHRRDKFLPANYTSPNQSSISNLWGYNYFEPGQQSGGQVFQQQDTFRKGDLIAFCVDVGNVSQKMLNVQAQEIWQYNQTATTNNANPVIYLGTTAYLMGMSYFNYNDRFTALASALHKVSFASQYQDGYGLLRPLRDGTGALTNNGAVIPVLPAVHMPNNGQAFVFNNSLHPDSGRDFESASFDWWLQIGVQGSAAEHGVLRTFFQTNAISTVKLLQQAGTNTVALNAGNFLGGGTVVYHGVQLQNADTNIWGSISNDFGSGDIDSEAFFTPGIVTNGNYVGASALFLSHSLFASLVGGLNGGYANQFPTATFSAQNSPNLTVYAAPDGSVGAYYLQTAPPVGDASYLVDGASTAGQQSTTYNYLVNGQVSLDPSLLQSSSILQYWFGGNGSQASTFNVDYGSGAVDSEVAAYNDASERAADPVNMMTGEFYVDTPDLSLPGPMPLQVRRNYGSQNLVENEFGFGWKLSYVPFLSVGTNSILLFAAEMDGTTVAYRQTATNANLWVPLPQDNPTLNNNSSFGIGSVGNLFNNRIQLSTPGGTNVYTLTGADGSARAFVQLSFPVGTLTRQRPYLTVWQDSRGNSYTFQYGNNSTQPDYGEVRRVQSSNGNFFGFYYDVYGHIIEAYAGDGRQLNYTYDQYGDLITVALPDESQINYVYQHSNLVTNGVTNVYSTHLIIQELKPEGRILQLAYDSQRRVTTQMATAGADLNPITTATFVYTNNFSLASPTNQLTGFTWVYDYTNHVTIYSYTNSLIQQVIDPLQQTVTQVWYGASTNGGYQRSLKSRTDKRGLTTAYLYDAFGNVTNTTVTGDITGTGATSNAVSSAVYNTNNLPLQVIDPVGNSVSCVYETNFPFLPQQLIKYAGATVVSTNFMFYDSVTNVVTDGSIQQTNKAFGVLRRLIRAYGSAYAATNETFYDGRGYPTNAVQYSDTSDPNVTNQFVYDERGEMVQRTDVAGRNYLFYYDPMGRAAGNESYDIGQTDPMDWTYLYYNENGELNWIDGPRYNPEDYIWRDYDGDGRKIQEIHWQTQANTDGSGVSPVSGNNLYATTFYQYDPLGDNTQITDPLGNYTVQSFDAIGQMTRQVFYGSNGVAMATNGFAHEPGGLVSAITNALGGVTTKFYTSTGKLKLQQYPDGSTNGWIYDLSGRVVTNFLANGNCWQTVYNDAGMTVSNIFYNATNSLATNVTQLDARGNVIATTDADGNLSTNLYDGLDRLKIAAGPVILGETNLTGPNGPAPNIQQIETYIYDASSRVLTLSNAVGEITTTTNDPIGRPIQVSIYPSNSVTPVRVTSTYYSPDHQSVTVTNGTGANAIATTVFTDTDGHTVLTLHYPTNGVTEYDWQQYDLAGNRVAWQQCANNNGTVTVWATNGWTYDGLNRMATEVTRDGATTTYGLDALGDITNRAMPGGLSWSASYLSDGRIAAEQEVGGGQTARSMTYQYYATGSPFAGKLDIVTDGRGTTRTNAYDDFLRLATVGTGGTSPLQQTLTTYQYDPVGLLTDLQQSFATNTTGSGTDIGRTFDAYHRIAYENVSLSGGYSGLGQAWDNAGRRSSLNGLNFAYQADGLMIAAGGSSFGYANSGLLTGRTNGARSYTVNQRDGRGRLLSAATRTPTAGTILSESLSWRSDGRLTNYIATRGDFADLRTYSYTSLSQRLAQEAFDVGVNAGHPTVTNVYTVDQGASGGLGVLTSSAQSGTVSGKWSVPGSGGQDGLDRVTEATDNVITRLAWGVSLGAATVTAILDTNKPVDVDFDGPDSDGTWRAYLSLTPGSHTLAVSSVDLSGQLFASTNSTFSVTNTALDTLVNQYDGNGNITNRVWVSATGVTNRTESMTWDAFDRLIQVSDRDGSNNGYNFVSVYDALGRRLQTTETLVTNNVPITHPASAISIVSSAYDPQVEFLEVGVSVSGPTPFGLQKVYGPDANGVYGGMQGVGGLEFVNPANYYSQSYGALTYAVAQDYFGNAIASISNSVVTWTSARFSAYGPVPGFGQQALSLDTTYANAVQSFGWRGKRSDPNGDFYLGARLYDPVAGRFVSADPFGHAASMDLYSFCGSDPVNFFDPSGRCSQQVQAQILSDPTLQMAMAGVDPVEVAQAQWLNSLPPSQQATANLPVPFLYNSIALNNAIQSGDQSAIDQASAQLRQEGYATLLTLGLFQFMGPSAGETMPVQTASQTGQVVANTTATQLEFPFVNDLPANPPVQWPPNGGFADNPATATLVPGTTVDRYGYAGGSYVSPTGTPFIQRSLAPGTQYTPYNVYTVLNPIEVQAGQTAPAFGMLGGGMQYKLPTSVQSLIDSGDLGTGN